MFWLLKNHLNNTRVHNLLLILHNLSNEKARIIKSTARDKILVWRVLLCTPLELAQILRPLPVEQTAQTGKKSKMKTLFAKTQKLWFAKIWRTWELGNFGLQKVSKTSKLWNSGLQKLRTNSETLMCKKSWNFEALEFSAQQLGKLKNSCSLQNSEFSTTPAAASSSCARL
jgi:hypothetical protein